MRGRSTGRQCTAQVCQSSSMDLSTTSDRNRVVREKWFLGLESGVQHDKEEEEDSSSSIESTDSGSSSTDPRPLKGDLADGAAQEVVKEDVGFLAWFLGDLRKSHLTWVKAVFFFQSASLVVLYPYLTIHMKYVNSFSPLYTYFTSAFDVRSLGFTAEDAALVNAALPAADVFGPPVAGILADRIGNFRCLQDSVVNKAWHDCSALAGCSCRWSRS